MFNPDIFSEKQVRRSTGSVFDIVEFLSNTSNCEKGFINERAVFSKGESHLSYRCGTKREALNKDIC